MAHLGDYLPERVELGALRRLSYSNEIVTTDGGYEVRNGRWATPLKTFELSFPTSRRNDDDYLAVIAMFQNSLGGVHSFNFREWTDETGATVVKVRFDTPLEITGIDVNLDHIEKLTLVEVRG